MLIEYAKTPKSILIPFVYVLNSSFSAVRICLTWGKYDISIKCSTLA